MLAARLRLRLLRAVAAVVAPAPQQAGHGHLFLGARADGKNLYLFAGVDKARFRRVVEPGDQMKIVTWFVARKKGLWRCRGEICVNNEIACSSDVLFTHRELR